MRLWLITQHGSLYDFRDTSGCMVNMGMCKIPNVQNDSVIWQQRTGASYPVAPVTCIAATPIGVGLNYTTLLMNFGWLRQYMDYGNVLAELEVPTDQIIALRYESGNGSVVTEDFENAVRQYRGNGSAIVALLPYVDPNWLVSMATYEEIVDSNGVHLTKLNPYEWATAMNPILRTDVVVDDQNIPGRVNTSVGTMFSAGKSVFTPLPEIDRYAIALADNYSSQNIFENHTIEEALLEVTYDTRRQLLDLAAQAGIPESKYPTMLCCELVNTY